MKFTSKKILVMTLMIYVLSSVLSYSAFSYFAGPSDSNKTAEEVALNEDGTLATKADTLLTLLLKIDPAEAKSEACPLNGKLFTKQEKDAWEMKRPLAIMIENSVDARPQSGLGDADIVFEVIAEGGVTRFMGLFYCGVQRYDTIIAPVRSARTYFVEYASGFNFPLYVHVGGANISGPANSLGQISDYGWSLENDMNQFSIGFPTFVRNNDRLDRDVATEHTMQSSTEDLWKIAAKREWTNFAPERKYGRTTLGGDDWKETYKSWSFQDEVGVIGTTTNIKYEFWDGFSDFGVEWQYDKGSNSYNRVMAGEPHFDLNTDKQIKASNVIVLLTIEKGPIDELKHMLYTTIGKGNALIFKNGDAIKATWSKATRESELEFFDRKGNEIEFARGLTWISVVGVSTEVTY